MTEDQKTPVGSKSIETRHAHTRNVGMDLARVIATFGVVVLHFVGKDSGQANSLLYFMSSFSIPVFVISSGYFVLNRSSLNVKNELGKASKLIAVIAYWCLVVWIMEIPFQGLGRWGLFTPIRDFALSAFVKGNDALLWYLWMLALIRVLSPLIKKLIDNFGWGVVIGISGCVCLAFDYISIYKETLGFVAVQSAVPQTLRLWTWVFYFALGGWLKQLCERLTYTPHAISLCILLFILGEVLIVVWGWGCRHQLLTLKWAEYLYDDLSVMLASSCLILSCVVGFQKITAGNENGLYQLGNARRAAIESLSSLGLGMYVNQVPVQKLVLHFYGLSNPLINIVLVVPAVYCALGLMTVLMKRIPIIQRLVEF
jgi:surface polysaccharide O-acyltransferase-like enzyme